MEMYVIAWQSQITGKGGHGTMAFDKAEAQRIATANNDDPKNRDGNGALIVFHWPQLVLDDENPTEPFTPVDDPDTIIFRRGEGGFDG